MTDRRRSWWGWGWEDAGPNEDQTTKLARSLSDRFGLSLEVRERPMLPTELPVPRVQPPPSLSSICSVSVYDRVSHALGKAYRDVVRASYGDLGHPPDLVAFPATETDVVALLDWCSSAGVAAVPYGGGSSVVGGVEYRGEGGFDAWVSIDLTRLDRVLEIDPVSRAARIQAGALGPLLDAQLRPRGYTLRHFPQSFEFSTLSGWLATRSGGHYATVYTHIDDLVESLRVVTPVGTVESRRLPGSGAGPSPDRLCSDRKARSASSPKPGCGSRNARATRAQRACASMTMPAASKRCASSHRPPLFPTNCRLLNAAEAATSAGVTDGTALLVLGFESADHPVDTWIERAAEISRDCGGKVPDGITISGPTTDDNAAANTIAGREGAVGAWRNAFLRAPYTRDALVRMSVIVETFETACTWDRFAELHAVVTEAATSAVTEICGAGWVTCRFTHVYPDGPAPYFSVFAPGRPGSEVQMWDEVKSAVSEALIANGGTITHHHAVGRDHDPWYRQQRPELHGAALAAAKDALDPAGIFNPGVIV